jgi:hypothetical protein
VELTTPIGTRTIHACMAEALSDGDGDSHRCFPG